MRLVAPYYGDLAPPGGQPGEPYSNLWDYEVNISYKFIQEPLDLSFIRKKSIFFLKNYFKHN